MNSSIGQTRDSASQAKLVLTNDTKIDGVRAVGVNPSTDNHNKEAASTTSPDTRRELVVDFLNTNPELRDYYNASFTGKFRKISGDLQAELTRNFPKYHFLIPEISVTLDPPSKRYNLILFTEAGTEKVVSYSWGPYWLLHPSSSFKWLMKGEQARSVNDAVNKVTALAKLLVFAVGPEYKNNDAIGRVLFKKGKVTAELIRGEGAFVLEVEIDKHLAFRSLAITLPKFSPFKRASNPNGPAQRRVPDGFSYPESQETTRLDVELRSNSLSGVVSDPNGNPLSDVLVETLNDNWRERTEAVFTDSNGHFAFEPSRARIRFMKVSKPAFNTMLLKVNLSKKAEESLKIELQVSN